MIRAQHGRFKPGIDDFNFDAAAEWAKRLGWNGPFILAADDTKVVAALRSFHDGDQWRLGGVHGTVHVFSSYEELMELGQVERSQLAEKVCTVSVYDVQVLTSFLDTGMASHHPRNWCASEAYSHNAPEE